MTVKKPVPCSVYDIRGIQEWLDEMALQGLFLKEVNPRFDRAEFELGDPAPVRYRVDPIIKGKGNTEINEERKEFYAQMGWTYVDQIVRSFYIFSCDDPEAPELYSDPQSLALALDSLVRRDVRNNVLFGLVALLFLAVLFIPGPFQCVRNILLWESLPDLIRDTFCIVLMVICIPALVFEVRRTLKLRDTLAQGLPLKAKKRRGRIPFYAWYTPLYLAVFILPGLFLPSYAPKVCGLDEAVLSHSWPTAVQMEAAGSSSLTEEPVVDGYIRYNDSPFAPVQEEVNRHRVLDLDDLTDTDLHTTIRYVRARSPRIARWLYQTERDQEFKHLEDRQSFRYTYRVTELSPFAPRNWPGLDRLEVTQYQVRGEAGWTFALLRGTDVLLVSYAGSARWEDCIPLFLEALDKEVTP